MGGTVRVRFGQDGRDFKVVGVDEEVLVVETVMDTNGLAGGLSLEPIKLSQALEEQLSRNHSGKHTLAVIAEQAVVKARSLTGRLREYISREVVYMVS